MVADAMRDHALAVRCWVQCYWLYHPCLSYIAYDGTYYSYPLVMVILKVCLPYLLYSSVRKIPRIITLLPLMITATWLLARYCHTIYMWYEVDTFTVYFLVWQFAALIYKWLYQDLPIISFTLHQQVTCLSMAYLAFTTYDIVFRLVPTYIDFAFFWLVSAMDIIICLHPKCGGNDRINEAVVDALSFDYPTTPLGVYCVYDINELNDDVEKEDKCNSFLGWGDFLIFNILLLLVIPTNSSITIRTCIAFGCIVSVQLADICTDSLLHYTDSDSLPALPLPTIAATAYAIVVDAIIEYSNLNCENLLK
ncbi:unnamed protein product [Rotaria socialis]